MRILSKCIVRFIGVALLSCLLVGYVSPTLINAEALTNQGLGSDEDNGIKLTITGYSIVNHGQNIKLHYTIHSNSNVQVNPHAASLMESPHIWIGHTLVRENSDSFKQVSNNEVRGTIVAQLHHYRPESSQMSFDTHGILNRKGNWTVRFVLNNDKY